MDLKAYKGKKVLITGHTGFKGSWLCQTLLELGAQVYGYALSPNTTPSMYELCNLDRDVESIIGDIRDIEKLKETFGKIKPDYVIHMAAQPIVREGYNNPVYTYDVNVMGTVNVLECVRNSESVKSFVNVTTDKVYKNKEREKGYTEDEELNGYDPYSNSKSCSELVTDSYKNSFFMPLRDSGRCVAVSTMRAGNVIGGGDFALDRIIPDMVRAAIAKEKVVLRNPLSIRPYQHVLEPIGAYLMVMLSQDRDLEFEGSYNIGPDENDCMRTIELAEKFSKVWSNLTGYKVEYNELDMAQAASQPHEAGLLKLNCNKFKETFGWKPQWNKDGAVENTAQWYAEYAMGNNMREITAKQIREYFDR